MAGGGMNFTYTADDPKTGMTPEELTMLAKADPLASPDIATEVRRATRITASVGWRGQIKSVTFHWD